LAADDKKHQKMLKEADKAFQKNYKLLKSGKITKDEFKKRILPYKEELIELGYPIKSSKKEKTEEEEEKQETETEPVSTSEAEEKPRVRIHPWKKKSNLTIGEIEEKIDELTLGRVGTEGLKALYQARYGEELALPEEDIHLLPSNNPVDTDEESTEEDTADEEEEIYESAPRKGLFRSVFRRSGGDSDS
jgi:hypothetical protein